MHQNHTPGHNENSECKFCNNIQIPNLPLKGPKTFEEILRDINKSIIDEAAAADFYHRLLKEAPNKLHKDFIEHALNDEKQHLQIFSRLYHYYAGDVPQNHFEPIPFSSYREGLLQALKRELEAIDFYNTVQLSTMDQLIIDTFYMVMVDEIGHSTMFSTLYNSGK